MTPASDRTTDAPDPPAEHAPWRDLALVVEDLRRARAELAAATREAQEAGAELQRRTAEIGLLNDVLEATLAVTEDVIVIVAAPTRRVRRWSAGAARRFGIPTEDVVGRGLASVRGHGFPARRLAEEVARLARSADRTATLEANDGRFRLDAVPTDRDGPVEAVVIRLAPPCRSDVHAGPQPVDDAAQPP